MRLASPAAATVPVYAGRFTAMLPAGTTVKGMDAELQELVVSEVAWSTEPGRADGARGAATRAWAARLAELRKDPTKRPDGAADVIITQRQLAPDLWLLYRHNGLGNSGLVASEALLDTGDHGMWIRAPYVRGRENEVAELFTRIARSYRPYAPGAPRPEDGPAFHLPRGAFRLPFDFQESVQLFLDAQAQGLHDVRFVSRTGVDPEWRDGLIAEWRAKQRSASLGRLLGGAKVTLLRAGPRTVAGMAGEEVVARFDKAGEPTEVALAWGYRGQNDAPLHPRASIAGRVVDGRVTDALAAWDQILGSLRALPHNADAAAAAPGGPR